MNLDKNPHKVDNLISKLKSQFPDFEIKNAQLIEHGWDHDVIDLDGEYIFRFTTNPDYVGRLKNEIKLLEAVSKNVEASIPSYEIVANDYSFGGYSKIQGERLSKELYGQLNEAQENALATQIADFLTGLHLTDVKIAEELQFEIEDFRNEAVELKSQVNELLKSLFDKNDIFQIHEILDQYSDIQIPVVSIVHRDFYNANIIFDKENLKLGVIDFSDVMIGDAATDFTELYEYSSEFVDKVYKHYQGPKDDTFLQRSRLYYKKVGIYLMVQSQLGDNIEFEEARAIYQLALSS